MMPPANNRVGCIRGIGPTSPLVTDRPPPSLVSGLFLCDPYQPTNEVSVSLSQEDGTELLLYMKLFVQDPVLYIPKGRWRPLPPSLSLVDAFVGPAFYLELVSLRESPNSSAYIQGSAALRKNIQSNGRVIIRPLSKCLHM